MALITRVSRLFRADLHAVLDRLEEPLTWCCDKQCVRWRKKLPAMIGD